jgi:raffinose/stachyose/melibiose transport system permease protein
MQALDETTPRLRPPAAARSVSRRRSADRARRRAAAGRRPPAGMRWAVALSLLPGLLLVTTFFLVPLVVLAITSFADWSGFGFSLIGIDNYRTMFGDSTFWKAVTNTALYAAAGIFIQVPLGLVVGIVLAQHMRGWGVFRAIIFIPFVISGAAYALVFSLFYNPRYGLLNSGLGLLGLDREHDWLFETGTALPAVAGTFVFILGFIVVLVMAEIASIPRELYEAAEVDGASVIQRQWYITVPLLRNVIGTCVLITLLGYLALFDLVFILTQGGPNDSTVTLTLYAYRAYANDNWGYANAVGVFIVITGFLLIVLVRRLFRIGERVQ